MTHKPIISLNAALALALLCAPVFGCSTWDGVEAGPAAQLSFDARLPDANAKRLRVQIHDYEDRCPGSTAHFYSPSFRGTISATEPPYTVELPASRRVWLNILYYDASTTHAMLTGFTLEPDGEYVALYRNDGKRFGFAMSSATTGEAVKLISPSDCRTPFRWSDLWGSLTGANDSSDGESSNEGE